LLSLGITHDVSIQGEADMNILNDADSASPLGGMLHGSATLQFGSNNFTANALFAQLDNRDGGVIDSNATLAFNLTGSFAIPGTNPGNPDFDATVPGEADILIENQKRGISQDSATSGGTIGGNALIQLSAASASTAGALDVEINNFSDGSGSTGGSIGGNATISLNIAGGLTTQADAFFNIANQNNGGTSGGIIGGDAAINLTATNISVGTPLAPADLDVSINNNGGTIGGNATINVAAANITANSLLAQIDNTGGSIGASTEGSATINMNVSGSATVTNDATFQILGSDGAASAAINFNGGNYDAGGTFLAFIDGDGTITFNNASAHADVLKAGVFGSNGVLNIGGGTLSADTTLKLYAPGSNGSLNFVSNVTLGGNSLKILAANSVTIFNNVVVTIGGSKPADVYTGFTDEIPNANYTGCGGNGSTTGTFGGAGANAPQPIENAPPFDNTNRVTSSGKRSGGGRPTNTKINVSSSDELLALLDGATPGPGGKITVRESKPTNHSRNANRIGAANRLNAASRRNADRRPVDMRTASSSLPRR